MLPGYTSGQNNGEKPMLNLCRQMNKISIRKITQMKDKSLLKLSCTWVNISYVHEFDTMQEEVFISSIVLVDFWQDRVTQSIIMINNYILNCNQRSYIFIFCHHATCVITIYIFPLKLLGQITKCWVELHKPFKQYILHAHLHSKICFLMILKLKHFCDCDKKN